MWTRMEHKKPHRKGTASEQAMTRRGLHIYQQGDQIKTLTGMRWDVASEYGGQVAPEIVCAQVSHMRITSQRGAST